MACSREISVPAKKVAEIFQTQGAKRIKVLRDGTSVWKLPIEHMDWFYKFRPISHMFYGVRRCVDSCDC